VTNTLITFDTTADSWLTALYMFCNIKTEQLIRKYKEYGSGRGVFNTLSLQALQDNP